MRPKLDFLKWLPRTRTAPKRKPLKPGRRVFVCPSFTGFPKRKFSFVTFLKEAQHLVDEHFSSILHSSSPRAGWFVKGPSSMDSNRYESVRSCSSAIESRGRKWETINFNAAIMTTVSCAPSTPRPPTMLPKATPRNDGKRDPRGSQIQIELLSERISSSFWVCERGENFCPPKNPSFTLVVLWSSFLWSRLGWYCLVCARGENDISTSSAQKQETFN